MNDKYNMDLFIDEYIIYSSNNIVYVSEMIDKYEIWYENKISKYNVPEKIQILNQIKKSKLEKYIIIENNKSKFKNIRLKNDLIENDKLLENEYFIGKDFEIWRLEIENYKLENENKIINLKKDINNNKILDIKKENENKKNITILNNKILKLEDEIKILKLENETKKDLVGNIYKIEYNKNPEIRYIGSTTKTIKNRYASHKTKYNKWLENDDYGKCEIYEYFKAYGIENFEITLLKEYKILNKNNLLAYEQLWMNNLININKNKAFIV